MTLNGLQSVLLIRLEEIYSASKWGGWMDIECVFEQGVGGCVCSLVPQPIKAFLCSDCLSEPHAWWSG